MNTFQDIKNKEIIIENLPKMISDLLHERDIYLTTFTFKNSSFEPSKADLRNYFTAFFQNINTNSMNQKKLNSHKKCMLIAFPEISFKKSIKNKTASIHFHGFLMIHKDNNERLLSRAVEKTTLEYDERLEKDVSVLHLKSKIINCLRSNNKSDFQTPLKLQSYSIDVRHLTGQSDIERAAYYMTKKFRYNFTYDDIQIYCNMKK